MRTRWIALVAVLGLGLGGWDLAERDLRAVPKISTESAWIKDGITVQDETARLNAWFDEQFEGGLNFSPIFKTILGRKDDYDKIDDASEAAAAEQLEWQRNGVAEMKATFGYGALSEDAKISYDLAVVELERAERATEFQRHQYIFHQMGGPHTFLPNFMINFHRVSAESDMTAYIARIGGISRALNQFLERAQAAAADGIRPPKFAYEIAADQSRRVVAGAPFTDGGADSALWGDAKRKIAALEGAGTISAARAEELRGEARAALLEHFGPAWQALITWLEEDMANVTEPAAGTGSLPNGNAYYAERLAFASTTDMTAEEIHELGLSEVARLRGEMEALKDKHGFDGSLQEFFVHIREMPENYYPNTDEGRQAYLDDATAVIDAIKGKLPDYFGILPKADLVVKRVEPFREQDGAPQHYFPGTPDGSRPGTYYVHLSDMTALPKNQLEVIAYHEGLPGHHMQIAISQELQNLPKFRTQLFYNAYVEGWALYSELLAKEMGGYQDTLSDFGRLTGEIWRAIRLVVDTGIHAKGWGEEQALTYFMENTPEPEASARSEVRRYMVIPGQAVGYKIGMLKIQELRAKAEEALGDNFDIRGFHDVVLGGGGVPLSILERRVDHWIAAVKGGA